MPLVASQASITFKVGTSAKRKYVLFVKRLNIAELKKLMLFNPTLNDTAGFFECSEDTITRFISKETGLTFFDFRQKYLGLTRIKLRQKAIQMALSGDRTMMIFALKNLCGWKDLPEFQLEQSECGLEFIDEND